MMTKGECGIYFRTVVDGYKRDCKAFSDMKYYWVTSSMSFAVVAGLLSQAEYDAYVLELREFHRSLRPGQESSGDASGL